MLTVQHHLGVWPSAHWQIVIYMSSQSVVCHKSPVNVIGLFVRKTNQDAAGLLTPTITTTTSKDTFVKQTA